MPDLVNQMFCEAHRCSISITGCMKRQAATRSIDPTRAWREYNSVPFDQMCDDCAQGKAIMKKYKDKKEELMETNSESRSHKMKSELEELEKAAQKRTNAGTDEEAAPPATNPCGQVAEVVTAEAAPGADTIKKNDHPVDLDEMIKQIFTAAGYSNLLDGLKQAAFIDMRPLHLEAIFLVLCQLEERGIEK